MTVYVEYLNDCRGLCRGKLAFHDTDTDILVDILARMSVSVEFQLKATGKRETRR